MKPFPSHLKFYICITQAFEKMPSHCLTLSHVLWNRRLKELSANSEWRWNPVSFSNCGAKCPLGRMEKWCLALWSQLNSLIWVAANETSGPAPKFSYMQLCVQQCTKLSPGSALWSPSHKPAASTAAVVTTVEENQDGYCKFSSLWEFRYLKQGLSRY